MPGLVELVEPELLSVLVPLAPFLPAPPGVVPVAGALAAFSPDEEPLVVSPEGLPAPVLVSSRPLVPEGSMTTGKLRRACAVRNRTRQRASGASRSGRAYSRCASVE